MENATPVLTRPSPAAAKTPFRFFTSLILQEATGLRASTLPQFSKLLRQVPASCIYHHTHTFVLQHRSLTPEPTNDLVYWVSEVLGEEPLGEQLTGIDTMDYANLEDLREAIAGTIDAHLQAHPPARLKFVSEGEEFFFVKSVHIVMPTSHLVSTLAEFAQALERMSIHSLYFHMFATRLRLGHPTNDFTIWLTEQLDLQELGERVARLNPYASTLEMLRSTLLGLIRQALEQQGNAHA